MKFEIYKNLESQELSEVDVNEYTKYVDNMFKIGNDKEHFILDTYYIEDRLIQRIYERKTMKTIRMAVLTK